jgi:mannose-6-phosphate isomerase
MNKLKREYWEGLKHSFIKPTDNLIELVWGGSYIEKMKGLTPSGRRIGESWECSAHPQHPSKVITEDGQEIALHQLLSLIAEEVLGRELAEEFNGKLPLLVKFIDAKENLSVQVHPSDEKARELGESDGGKDEAWFILDADEDAVLYQGFNQDVDKDEFERDLLFPGVNIAHKYLNAIPVKKGEIFFNPAGTIHAIGNGIVLAEIQQSSGLTYRVWDWNRTPQRPFHIGKALTVLDFSQKVKGDFYRIPRKLNQKEERLIDSLSFSVDRITLEPGGELIIDTKGGFQILTCLEGEITLQSQKSPQELSCGRSLLVPAALSQYRIATDKGAMILESFLLTPEYIDPVIFQTYDVRATADEYLSDRVVFYLGKGYGTFLRRFGHAPSGKLWAAVGGGIRLSTERMRKPLIKGILSSGVNVYDLGVTSTPELYFSIPYLGADGGINITGSHNEAEYNGLKQVIKTPDGFITSINAEEMLQIKGIVLAGDFLPGEGKYIKIEADEIATYHNQLVKANCRLGRSIWVYLLELWKEKGLKALLDTISQLEFPEGLDKEKWEEIKRVLDLPDSFDQPETAVKHPLKNLKLVIDFGNGSSWRTKEVYTDLGAEVVALNEEPDGSFPAHTPDPIKAKYRHQLEEAVVAEARKEEGKLVGGLSRDRKEVVGFGYDEDGDRIIYVRSDGRVVEGDRTLAIQAKSIIEEYKRQGKEGRPRFMGEVKFSKSTGEFITALGGEFIMNPTGFAFIKDGTKTLCRAIMQGLPGVDLFGKWIDLTQSREPIALAAELSGHQMSGQEENWIFDDGALAATKVLTVIAKALNKGKTFIDLDEEIPRYPASPELNISLPTNVLLEKQAVVERVLDVFRKKGYSIDTTDGGIIKWVDSEGNWLGQALVRKSNTQSMLICRVEGRDEQAKAGIEDEFFSELSQVSTEAVPKLDLASDDYIKGILPRI